VADVAVVVVPADHLHVSVTIGPHEDVQLLPHRVHGGRRLSQPFHTEKRRGSAGFIRVSAGSGSKRRCSLCRDGDAETEKRRCGPGQVCGSQAPPSLSLSLLFCCLDGLGLFFYTRLGFLLHQPWAGRFGLGQ
jgi:hypothetical protein